MSRISVYARRTIILACFLVAVQCSRIVVASECYLVKKCGYIPYVYSPGYWPGCRHVVAVYDRAAPKNMLADHEVWTYRHEDAAQVKTGYEIGVARSCGCWGRCRCGSRLYLWMAVPPDRIHAAPLTYIHPGERQRQDLEDVWDALGNTALKDHFTGGDPMDARRILCDMYVAVSPKTFRDLLKHEYGFTSLAGRPDGGLIGTVDLSPGMRLRADFSLWSTPQGARVTTTQAPSYPPPQTGKTTASDDRSRISQTGQTTEIPVWHGYAPVGNAFYDVVRSVEFCEHGCPHERVAVSPFFGILRQDGVGAGLGQTGGQPSQLVHNAFALNHNSNQLPRYWRLLYPDSYDSRQNPQPEPASHVLLMSAHDADKLTDQACKTSRGIPWSTTPGTHNDVLVYAFSGHATITPQIAATIGGSRNFIELGSTVRQQVEVFHDVTPRSVSGISLMRDFEGRSVPVRFAGSDLDLYELPLLKGDRLQW